jgi:hypothetical protein
MSTDTTVSPLRLRMIEDIAARKLGPRSQRNHIYSCKHFAAFLKRSADTATADDVRRYLVESLKHQHSQSDHDRGEVPVPRHAEAALSGGRDLPPQGAGEAAAHHEPQRGGAVALERLWAPTIKVRTRIA